ncbi:hypothetical protein ACE6H2_022915 [Prunus campanulata]
MEPTLIRGSTASSASYLEKCIVFRCDTALNYSSFSVFCALVALFFWFTLLFSRFLVFSFYAGVISMAKFTMLFCYTEQEDFCRG